MCVKCNDTEDDCISCERWKAGDQLKCLECGFGRTLNKNGHCEWPRIEGCQTYETTDRSCKEC